MKSTLYIDSQRLQAKIDELALITEVEPPAVTRVLFSSCDLKARAWLQAECRKLDLALRVDAVGNFFARWEGSEPILSPIATGSHIDAIPNAGRYDGVVGVLGALEAIRALKASGFKPRRSLELIAFTAEEPTRFGLGCLGSRLMSGSLSINDAMGLEDKDGVSLAAWLKQMDFDGHPLENIPVKKSTYRAFVELHIEQGPILEVEGFDIGVVEKIAAPCAFRLTIEGEGGHAGAVLMPQRRDAFMGACEVALALERAAIHSKSPDTVVTVGGVRNEPNAINSIPFRTCLEIDLRDTDLEARSEVLAELERVTQKITDHRGLEIRREQINFDPPAIADPALVNSILHHASEANYKARKMISRAYHDSLFMALLCPFSMIFIPCRGGVSHRPDEFSTPEQMAAGVSVLARTLSDWSLTLD